MSKWLDKMERVDIETPVYIPTADGSGVAETVMVKVSALRDPATGETYLDGAATGQLDRVKARLMGVLLPKDIKELRLKFNLSQKQISDLLGIGEKTYTRWESGRERPSQSLNKLLMALAEGRLNYGDLVAMKEPKFNWFDIVPALSERPSQNKAISIITSQPVEGDHESLSSAA